jgi:predicted transposase/invertase (TIGR01784 family)
MSVTHQPHDHFFRATFGRTEVASDFMQHYLPEGVRAILDLSTLQLREATFIDAELREHISDLLYRVDIREGGAAYIYLLFEHKSYPDPTTAFQLLRYVVRIWEHTEQAGVEAFPPVVPVVLYHGAADWNVPTHLSALTWHKPALASYIPDFEYVLCDLSAYSDADLVGGVMERVALLALKHVFDTRGEWRTVLPPLMDLLAALARARDSLDYIQIVLRYLASAAQQLQPEVLHKAIDQTFPKDGGTLMNTIAQEWVRQGREEGIEQGIEQGKKLGALQATREDVLHLIELRFGKVTAHTATVLGRIDDLAQMKELFKHAATAESLPEFEDALPT